MTIVGEKADQPTKLYQSGRRDTGTDHYLLLKEAEFIARFSQNRAQTGILLDLCCGGGELFQFLSKAGHGLVGLDVDPLALAASRREWPDVPTLQGDALHLPFSNGSLGTIVAIHCFDHLDRIRFLQECNRVLCSGHLLIFDALNRHSYKPLLKRLRPRTSIRSHPDFLDKYVNVFSWREVQQALAGAGFDVQAVSGYGWIPLSVNSRSKLVNAAAWVERILRLDRLPGVSPRVLVAAR